VRAPQGALDPQGRVQPRMPDDNDQFEIPAFLRRLNG
jgi:cell division protein FtsZ